MTVASSDPTRNDDSQPRFVAKLPGDGRGGGSARYDALTKRPGEWAEWWGAPGSVRTTVRRTQRDGFRFEACRRSGKDYIRAVKA